MTNRLNFIGHANSKKKSMVPFFLGLLAGLGLSLLTIYLRSSNQFVEGRGMALENTFRESLANGPRDIEMVEKLLRDILTKIESRPKLDSVFRKSSQKFIPLVDFDPTLAETVPKQFRQTITVRADGVDAKIMMGWRLCGVAQVFAPQLLDPIRSTRSTIGCPYFGIWTTGASEW